MPGAGMAGLPMPPAMMMPGPRQGPLGPMGGPARMPGPSGQPGMRRPPHAPPPRPMHQVSPVPILKRGSNERGNLPVQIYQCIEGSFMSLGPDSFLSGIQYIDVITLTESQVQGVCLQGMDRGQQPPPPQSQRPREPIRWPPAMDKQHGLQHGQRMDGPHGRQLDVHMGPQRQPHMERPPEARMMQNNAPALPFPPGMGDLMKQRLCMGPGAGEYHGSPMSSSG